MVDFHYLGPGEWATLRDIRLRALGESPEMFLASHDQEQDYRESEWRAEFNRSRWIVGFNDDDPISLVGITFAVKEDKHYIEYMWVAPQCRGSGVATQMLDFAFAWLCQSGVKEVYLWILDGNEPAALLYKKKGFVGTNEVHELKEKKPGRTEEQLRLALQHPSERPGESRSATMPIA